MFLCHTPTSFAGTSAARVAAAASVATWQMLAIAIAQATIAHCVDLRLLTVGLSPSLYSGDGYPRFVRRAVCPTCGLVTAPERAGELHTHGRRLVVLAARMIRVPLYPVEQTDLDAAVSWLDEHWHGGMFLPDELLELVAVA